MSFFRRPLHWLGLAACAAGFWITFRVLTASAPALPVRWDVATDEEVADPALERLIAGFAAQGEAEKGWRGHGVALANQ